MTVLNSYYYFSEALSSKICDDIINSGLASLNKAKSLNLNTYGTTAGKREKQSLKSNKIISQEDKTLQELKNSDSDVYIRDSEVSWLTDNWLYDIVWSYVNEANQLAGWKYEIDFAEACQFTTYHSPSGFYGWHYDGLSDHNSKYKKAIPGITPLLDNGLYENNHTDNLNLWGKVRKLSMTINLNKPGDYEGGNLKFDFGHHTNQKRFHECTEIRPQGSVIVFPSYVYHQVTPVTKGTRYSLVVWFTGRPLK
jgi:PKHD-type hydroxylase